MNRVKSYSAPTPYFVVGGPFLGRPINYGNRACPGEIVFRIGVNQAAACKQGEILSERDAAHRIKISALQLDIAVQTACRYRIRRKSESAHFEIAGFEGKVTIEGVSAERLESKVRVVVADRSSREAFAQ